MKLAVVSHKPCWPCATSPTGWATDGGFPFQMRALAGLATETTLVVTASPLPAPSGLTPLAGLGMEVVALPEPGGRGLARKLRLPAWLLRQGRVLLGAVRRADGVHAAVPGDVGTLGLLAARLLRKPLFVRHCGTWGDRATVANRFLAWLLPRIARDPQTVVLATGGGPEPPEPGRPEVCWIFSTSLSEETWRAQAPRAERPAGPLRLVTVGRLTRGKNQEAAIRAVGLLAERGLPVTLDVVGAGPTAERLASLVDELDLGDRVRLHGNLPHARVLALLREADLFVFPTRVAEGFPKAVLEAMASGLPVLAPPVSVLATLLADGAGALLAGTDAEAVADAVAPWIDAPEQRSRAGQRAREVSRGYTLEAWTTEIGRHLDTAWGLS